MCRDVPSPGRRQHKKERVGVRLEVTAKCCTGVEPVRVCQRGHSGSKAHSTNPSLLVESCDRPHVVTRRFHLLDFAMRNRHVITTLETVA